jgi:NADH-quinone oxidoreductase subunit C
MPETILHSAPRIASSEGVLAHLVGSLGGAVLESREEYGEIVLSVARDTIEDTLRTLRDEHDYQQLMEIAGVDYPNRPERFQVVYMLLSLTKNHRILVKCSTDEATPVPTVTTLWPVAGWFEREVFDMYGVLFEGNTDLRRILTDYGFQGHPQRKDFPLTGYVELRYSEEDKRVVYEPVELAQDLRTFDFMSPWEGADYVLPGDEKADAVPPAPAPVATKPETKGAPAVESDRYVKGSGKPGDSAADSKTNAEAGKKTAHKPGADIRAVSNARRSEPNVPVTSGVAEPFPEPTEKRPARKPRASSTNQTQQATRTRARKKPPAGEPS